MTRLKVQVSSAVALRKQGFLSSDNLLGGCGFSPLLKHQDDTRDRAFLSMALGDLSTAIAASDQCGLDAAAPGSGADYRHLALQSGDLFFDLPVVPELSVALMVEGAIALAVLGLLGTAIDHLCRTSPRRVWLLLLTFSLSTLVPLALLDLITGGQASATPAKCCDRGPTQPNP